MAFIDALQDTVTIYSIALSTNADGEQVKTPSALYSNIPCRIHGRKQLNEENNGAFEKTTYNWTLMLEASRTGITRGMRAVVNGDSYLITKVHELKGNSPTIHHIICYLQEQPN